MDIKLGQAKNKILVDDETLSMLEELTGLDKCCYDWWELSQGLKDLVMSAYLFQSLKK